MVNVEELTFLACYPVALLWDNSPALPEEEEDEDEEEEEEDEEDEEEEEEETEEEEEKPKERTSARYAHRSRTAI